MRVGPFFVEFNRAALLQFGMDSDRFGATVGLLCKRPNTGHRWDAFCDRTSAHVDAGPLFFVDLYR